MKIPRSDRVFWFLGLLVLAAAVYCLVDGDCTLLTPDQRGYRLFIARDYEAAAAAFSDPWWQGAALFHDGEFEQAAGVFAGLDTPEAAFNHGNALVMQGKYEEAVTRYDRALELRADWEPAVANRAIAAARAALLAKKGGDMTGGKLEADEIVFSEKKSPAGESSEPGEPLSDEELRAIWLRNVQTKPADFLRAKFAFQLATRKGSRGGTE